MEIEFEKIFMIYDFFFGALFRVTVVIEMLRGKVNVVTKILVNFTFAVFRGVMFLVYKNKKPNW